MIDQSQVQRIGHKWQEMSEQDLLHRIAQTIKSFKPSLLDKVSSHLQSRLLSVSTVLTDCETSTPLSSLSPAQQVVDAVVDCVIAAMTQTSELHQEIDPESGNELLKFNTDPTSLSWRNHHESYSFLSVASHPNLYRYFSR